jgi:hypothetical protein
MLTWQYYRYNLISMRTFWMVCTSFRNKSPSLLLLIQLPILSAKSKPEISWLKLQTHQQGAGLLNPMKIFSATFFKIMNLFYKDIEICVTITSPLRKSRIQRILIFRICWGVFNCWQFWRWLRKSSRLILGQLRLLSRSLNPVLDRIPYHKSQKPHQIMCLPNFSPLLMCLQF